MLKKGFLTGLLLFGIFFGAGNLIFPPQLGNESGILFVPAILGFVLSGVGLAIITLIVGTLDTGGFKGEITKKIGRNFAYLYLALLYLTIGPFFAIPRTANTSFSIGVLPLVGKEQPALLIFGLLYFACAYALSLNPSKLLDRVGKVLTPIFVLLIIVLIIEGNIAFSGQLSSGIMIDYSGLKAFSYGFISGYNTLDALASVAFCIIAIRAIQDFGFSSKTEYLRIISIVGVVTTLFFSVLYIGLGALGNKYLIPEALFENSSFTAGTYILSQASKDLFGSFGQMFLGAMTILTCFTTTVGLIVVTSQFFYELYPKFSYRFYVNLFTGIGLLFANLGLKNIITFSVPVLMILYPVTISIVLIIIIDKFVKLSPTVMRWTMYSVVIASIISILPILNMSFIWIPVLVVGIFVSIVKKI